MVADLKQLTPRELEVVKAAVGGGTIQSVAESLYISPRTVEHHLSRAYRKLGVRNRMELMARLASAPMAQPTPVTRYARSGDGHVAYQVFGDGDGDVVLIPGFISNVETAWTWPAHMHFLTSLSSGRRVIVFDKRGTGLSDPVSDPARLTLEERMDEVRAVMDAAASRRATLFGFSEGAALSMLFAATYPARTDGLILYAALISGSFDSNHRGSGFEDPEAARAVIQEVWGTGQFLAPFGPSATKDPDGIDHIARFERHGASPAAADAILRMARSIEARALCPAVHAPTLIMHRREDTLVPVANSRYLNDHLPDVRYVELDGNDHPPWLGDTDAVLLEIDTFMARSRRRQGLQPSGVLQALMATDAPFGSNGLRALERFRGRPSASPTGTVYTFDGPLRAAQCALSIAGGKRRIAVHAGEVRFTATGLQGASIDVLAALLAATPEGSILTSATLKELALGSGLDFKLAGEATVSGLGAVAMFHLAQPKDC